MRFVEKPDWAHSYRWFRASTDNGNQDLNDLRGWLADHFGAESHGISSETLWRYSVFVTGDFATDVWVCGDDDALMFKMRWC